MRFVECVNVISSGLEGSRAAKSVSGVNKRFRGAQAQVWILDELVTSELR